MNNNDIFEDLSNFCCKKVGNENLYNVYYMINKLCSEKLYNTCYLINGVCIDNAIYYKLNTAIRDAAYYLKFLSYKVDQIKIYKNGVLIAELNK